MADLARGNILSADAVFQITLNGTVSRGDPIGQDGTNWVRAAGATVSPQGFAMADGVSGDVITACRRCVQQTATTVTVGNMVWLSATAGRIADADPGALATMSHVLGYVAEATPSGILVLDVDIPHIEATWAQSLATIMVAGQFINFFIARRPYRVLGAVEVHSVAGTDGGAVTLTIEKIPSGTAKGSGTNVLSTTFNLKSTANTGVWVGPNATAASARLAIGDRLGAVSTGTLTALIDSCCTVQLVALER